ncbi:MAG: hypothetical protein ACRCUA_01960 [Fusobacteriaceae bacterium]
MAKIDIASRLKNNLAKAETIKTIVEKNELKFSREHFDFSFINEIECDESIKVFLRDKAIELITIQGKTVLSLGKICEEVAVELGKKGSPEGIYLKWLNFNGLKKDTALRARKRYELFSMAINSKLKEIILLLKITEIEVLYKEKEEFMKNLNSEKNIELKRVKEMIINVLPKTPPKFLNRMEIHDVEENMERFNNIIKNLKIAELTESKKEKLESILIQLEKLLG